MSADVSYDADVSPNAGELAWAFFSPIKELDDTAGCYTNERAWLMSRRWELHAGGRNGKGEIKASWQMYTPVMLASKIRLLHILTTSAGTSRSWLQHLFL